MPAANYAMTYDLEAGPFLAQLNYMDQEVARRAQMLVAYTMTAAVQEISHQITDVFRAVDTGRLLGSFTVATAKIAGDSATAMDGMYAVVGTNVPYAVPVHEGYARVLKRAPRAVYGRRDRKKLTRKGYAQRLATAQGLTKDAHKVGKNGKTKMQAAQEKLKVSTATYSYGQAFNVQSHEAEYMIHVEGRPFVAAALPKIHQEYNQAARELFEPLGFTFTPIGGAA